MKILYPFLLVILSISAANKVNAQIQVLFNEDFDGVPGSTSGGAGTYSFPSGWLLANVDNRSPNPSVGYVNEAWERREDFGTNVSDSCAFSTSWYSPVGQADDWMWTPAIPLDGNSITLTWNAKAYDAGFADGYEVRIMTVPPVGGTGNIGNMVSASTLLFNIPAENSSWTTRSIILDAYKGSTVYIGFRNNSNDKFLLAIDDVMIQSIANTPTLFVEDFDGVPGSTSGGAGTYSFPSGWLLANVDNRSPNPSVAYVNEAWERREDFGSNVSDSCAFSTSWYSPVGQADDWMWTPPIPLVGNSITLTWNAKAYDAGFADGYEMRIMTVPPMGGTGNIGNMVSASTILFNITAENSFWTTRSINLDAYKGSTVYIGFRNNSNDKFLLAIDDIKVAAVASLPLTLVDFWGSHVSTGNILKWKVADQINIQDYTIESSNDQSQFKSIGKVTAISQMNNTYQFTDKYPIGNNNFYRLKIQETSGTVSYSKIIAIRSTPNRQIQLFPNPATSIIYVQLPELAKEQTLEIIDVAGRRVKMVDVQAGANSISVDITVLGKGLYYLKSNNEVIPFVKQ